MYTDKRDALWALGFVDCMQSTARAVPPLARSGQARLQLKLNWS
jgi:hypothetical protein